MAERPEPTFTKGQRVRLRKRADVTGTVREVIWFEATGFNPIARWGYKTSWGSTYPEHELVELLTPRQVQVVLDSIAGIDQQIKEAIKHRDSVGRGSVEGHQAQMIVDELRERRRGQRSLLGSEQAP